MAAKKVHISIEGAPLVSVPAGIATAIDKPKDVSLSFVFDDGRKPVTKYMHPVTGEIHDKRPSGRGTVTGKDEHGEVCALVPMDKWNAVNSQIKLDIKGFVPRAELATRVDRVCDVHYVQIQAGTDPGALAMIAEGMRRADTVAVCEFAVGRATRIGLLTVRADGVLVVVTLSYAEHMKDPEDAARAIAEVEAKEANVAMVEQLIEASMLDPVEALDEVRDESLAVRRAILDKVVKGEEIVTPEGGADTEDDTDLTKALEESIAAIKAAKKPKAKKKKAAAAA